MAALPFLGHGLDPSLFDAGALARLMHDGRLPVRVSYHGPRPPALPGVVVSHAVAGIAAGYLTAASARRFGAVLERQFLADHDHASYGTDGLFAHRVSVALADGAHIARRSAAPRHTGPRFVMHTLTVRATGLAGRPDNGDG